MSEMSHTKDVHDKHIIHMLRSSDCCWIRFTRNW